MPYDVLVRAVIGGTLPHDPMVHSAMLVIAVLLACGCKRLVLRTMAANAAYFVLLVTGHEGQHPISWPHISILLLLIVQCDSVRGQLPAGLNFRHFDSWASSLLWRV
jgi:hypothetical protein